MIHKHSCLVVDWLIWLSGLTTAPAILSPARSTLTICQTGAKAFNDQRLAEKLSGKPWQAFATTENQYGSATRDDYQYERALPGDGKLFPHVVSSPMPGGVFAYSTLALTPMANQMALELARDAFEKENLGTHADADYLAVGLSAGGKLGRLLWTKFPRKRKICSCVWIRV